MKFSLRCAALALGCALPCFGHIGYSGRDFGTLVNNAAPVVIAGHSVTGNYGWADGTDADLADSHKLRYYRFKLEQRAWVNISVSASTNEGTKNGGLKPAFSIFRGLAHVAPITTEPGGSADHDGSKISLAWRATQGDNTEGCFRALGNWRIGGDNQTGPSFDFNAPNGLSTFTYVGHRADGDAFLFGQAEGIDGDGMADGRVSHALYLDAGDYTLAVGGAIYAAGLGANPDAQSYGVVASLQALQFAHLTEDPAEGGIGYQHQLILTPGSSGEFSDHVGAWSWEDRSLFGGPSQGTQPVGWTHTSKWLALRVASTQYVTVSMERDADVPWPSGDLPDRKADTQSMFPSLTLWRGWDNDGDDFHTYNNRGPVSWAEDLRYLDHIDNSRDGRITRTWLLPAGEYSLALGSKAAATNSNRQGFKLQIQSADGSDPALTDPSPDGIDYDHVMVITRGLSGELTTTVGAQSWWDPELVAAPPASLGSTSATRWIALYVKDGITLNFTLRRNPANGSATTALFPSFTLWRGWDNDGATQATYPNRGTLPWAEDLSYLDHGDNPNQPMLTRSYTLTPGCYTLALGSQSPEATAQPQDLLMTYATSTPVLLAPQILQQPRSLEVVAGARAIFSVRASGPDLSYEWLRGGVPISGANQADLVIAAASEAQAGSLQCVVRNSAGLARSEAVTLRVISKPVLTPLNIPDLVVGQPVSLQLQASPAATSFAVSGLPRGLTLNRSSGLISGRPLAISAEIQISATATNAAGSSVAVTDRFAILAPPAGLIGRFATTLPRSVALNQMLGGHLAVEINSLGTLSGSLTLGAAAPLRFVSALPTQEATPTAQVALPRKGLPNLALTLMFNPGAGALSGSLADAADSVDFATHISAPTVAKQAASGGYTMAMRLQSADLSAPWIPQGFSVAGLSLSPLGMLNAVLLLADGSRITLGGELLTGLEIPLFAALYRGTGSALGNLRFESSGSVASSEVSWFKAATPKDLSYAEGFGPIELECLGRRFASVAASALPLGNAGTNNAQVRFEAGGIFWSATNPNCDLTIEANAVKPAAGNAGSVSLIIDKGRPGSFTAGASGSFRGNFKLTDTDASVTPQRSLARTVTFQGMLVDDGEGLKGYGFFVLPQLPTVQPRTTLATSPRLSGRVMLTPKL